GNLRTSPFVSGPNALVDFLQETESFENRFEQFSCLAMRLLPARSQFNNLPTRQPFPARVDENGQLCNTLETVRRIFRTGSLRLTLLCLCPRPTGGYSRESVLPVRFAVSPEDSSSGSHRGERKPNFVLCRSS